MSRCRSSIPLNPSMYAMVAHATSYERARHLLTPTQRVAVRYMVNHGNFDRSGWWGTKDGNSWKLTTKGKEVAA